MKYFILKKHLAKFLLVLLLALLANLFSVTSAFLPAFALQKLLDEEFLNFVYFIIAILATGFLGYLLDYINRIIKEDYIQKCLNEYRFQFVHNLTNFDYAGLQTNNSAVVHNQINNDLQNFKDYSLGVFLSFFDLFFTIIFALASLLFLNWVITLIALLMLFLSFLIPILLNGYIQKIANRYAEANQKHYETIYNLNSGLMNLFLLNRIDLLIAKMQGNAAWFRKEDLQYVKKNILASFFIYFISAFSQIVLIALSLVLAIVNVPAIPTSITAVFSITALAGNLFGSFGGLFEGINKIPVGLKALQKNLAKAVAKKEGSKQLNLPFEQLRLENVRLELANKTILDNFSYTFLAKQKYLIIGKSGTGKSSLIHLLMGHYQAYEGNIFWNDDNLHDLKQSDLHDQIAFCQTFPYLFLGTLQENVTLFDQDLNVEKLKRAENQAVLNFADATKTNTPTNAGFSTGQQQRIGIARSLYADKPILIFDEALANLDKTTANQIEDYLLQNPNLTFIHISHHIDANQMAKYDAIINFDQLGGQQHVAVVKKT